MLAESKFEGGLGFKDLLAFNLSLLGKMAWRLLQQPNALRIKFLKRIYFRNSDFLLAQRGGWVSWLWQSLLDSKRSHNF